jgi:hypothetical protein
MRRERKLPGSGLALYQRAPVSIFPAGYEMKLWHVWHQYPPVRIVERKIIDGEELRLFDTALFDRGTVSGIDAEDAIAEAIRRKLSPHPIVLEAS